MLTARAKCSKHSCVSRLKIAPGATYEPGDIEIDPRFELMGEFQDLRLTRDSRQKDAIMSEVFRWMNDFDYQLNMLSTVTLINQIGEVLVHEMKVQDLAFEEKYGLTMTAADMAQALEKYR